MEVRVSSWHCCVDDYHTDSLRGQTVPAKATPQQLPGVQSAKVSGIWRADWRVSRVLALATMVWTTES